MKFLIDNYSDYNTTQPLYFHQHINEYDEHQCHLKSDNSISMYDLFDRFEPDVYITSAHKISKDAVMYLKENQKDKDIKLAIYIQNVKNNEVLAIEDLLKKHGVSCSFFFLNCDKKHKPITKNTNVVMIQDGADVNLSLNLDINFNIDRAFIIDKQTQFKSRTGTYHVITTNPELKDLSDFSLPINLLTAMYSKYNEIIFTNLKDHIPQSVFDAITHGNKVYYDIEDKDASSQLDEIFDKTFGIGSSMNYKSVKKLEDFSKVKELTVDKHNSRKRTRSLLSQIPNAIKA